MVKVSRSAMWYRVRLGRYFDKHYLEYENTITWFVDPAVNQWLFDIPELSLRIELTCDNQGNVTEEKYSIKGASDK